MGKEVTTGEYAKIRGITPQAVRKAIAQGRIRRLPNGKLDREEADRMWEENTRPYVKRK